MRRVISITLSSISKAELRDLGVHSLTTIVHGLETPFNDVEEFTA